MKTYTYNKHTKIGPRNYLKTCQLIKMSEEQSKANKLLEIIGEKDIDTAGHCVRVAKITEDFCNELHLDKEEKSKIILAALIHDVGKITIPNSILKKPGKLTDSEFEIMQKHVLCTFILPDFEPDIIDMIECHHERFNGSGYPRKLKGKEIPLGARIIAIADSIDAMRSKRCYKTELDEDFIMNELRNNAGVAYDPQLTEIALKNQLFRIFPRA